MQVGVAVRDPCDLVLQVFDYRTFGGSDGEPRQWVSPRRHLQDWRAAVRFVQVGQDVARGMWHVACSTPRGVRRSHVEPLHTRRLPTCAWD